MMSAVVEAIAQAQAAVRALRANLPAAAVVLAAACEELDHWSTLHMVEAELSGRIRVAGEVRRLVHEARSADPSTEAGRAAAADCLQRAWWYVRDVQGP